MAQINPTVGALAKNADKILKYARRALKADADLVVFPEMAITGYPPEDLLLKPRFIEDNLDCLAKVSRGIRGITAIIGFVDTAAGGVGGVGGAGGAGGAGTGGTGGRGDLYNAAAIVHGGRVVEVYHKMFLPNYGVFDEERYFRPGRGGLNFTLGGVTVGVGICEDIWFPEGPGRAEALAGAGIIVNINASPYYVGKGGLREDMLTTRALDYGVIIAYNNTVGGQDELVFDGQGMIIDKEGSVIARGKAFDEDLFVADLDVGDVRGRARARIKVGLDLSADASVREITLGPERAKKRKKPLKAKAPPESPGYLEKVLRALLLGTRDYVKKNGFGHSVIGLSGGIDSSLVAALAVEALGRENVTGVFMPSKYTSRESRVDARAVSKNLGIELLTIPIQRSFTGYMAMLKGVFKKRGPDETEENVQARIRGNVLMALSNKFGWLVLTTGNKSEMSVGYATLYGDMAGGFAVIKDVPKTLVYELSEYMNARSPGPLIPERVLTKAPTAELRPGQKDQDTLPPYDVLDAVLKAYIEENRSLDDIAAMGFTRATVKKVIAMVDRSEYKRRQAPPGIKITPRALGKDRRMPITNRYESR